jgi:hypothetical protein
MMGPPHISVMESRGQGVKYGVRWQARFRLSLHAAHGIHVYEL